MVIVSGIQPSGRLHVGNELGAVRNWIRLQGNTPSPTSLKLRGTGGSPPERRGEKNECFFFIADWHSLTEEYDPKGKAAQVRELAAELLALGVGTPIATPSSSPPRGGGETDRVVLFRQSDLPEHLELAWYLACVSPVGVLERMTQYKEKLAQGESPNVGLFTYPVLMAADILAYARIGQQGSRARTPPLRVRGARGVTNAIDNPSQPSTRTSSVLGRPPLASRGGGQQGIGVPVGDDQKQHLELANDIVRRFNNRFGPTFSEIQYLPAPVARVMSLKDPMHKMSKSLGGDHCLFLDDPPTEIERKIRSAVTDTGPSPSRSPSRREGEKKNSFPTSHGEGGRGGVGNAGMSSGVRTLFEILEAFGTKAEVTKFRKAHEAGTIKYSELKPAVAKAFANAHADFRAKKAELMAHPDRIDAALTVGAKAARVVASATLVAVRERVGIQ